jgi:hypothetical protein
MMSPRERLECAVYWREEFGKLDALVREHPSLLSVADYGRYRLMQDFAYRVGDMLALIADTLLPKDFEELKKYGFGNEVPSSPSSRPGTATSTRSVYPGTPSNWRISLTVASAIPCRTRTDKLACRILPLSPGNETGDPASLPTNLIPGHLGAQATGHRTRCKTTGQPRYELRLCFRPGA